MVSKVKLETFLNTFSKHFSRGRSKWIRVDVAHWESWVGQNKTSRCMCCGKKNGPRCSFKNRRYGKNWQSREYASYTCQDCVKLIEDKLGVEFQYSYAP